METTKYTTEEMNTMFTAIQNKDHWKNPRIRIDRLEGF